MARVQVQIPEEDRTVLRTWLFGNPRLETVLVALEKATPALSHVTLAEAVAKETKQASEEVIQLIRTLIHLVSTIRNLPDDEQQVAPEAFFRALGMEQSHRPAFEELFQRLLRIPAIETTGKALNVLLDNQYVFRSARTLSEIRPIFSEDGLDPTAAVLLHQLKIEYTEGPRRANRKEVFIAMDYDDLEYLKDVIERALVKHSRMKSLIPKLGIQLLEETDGPG